MSESTKQLGSLNDFYSEEALRRYLRMPRRDLDAVCGLVGELQLPFIDYGCLIGSLPRRLSQHSLRIPRGIGVEPLSLAREITLPLYEQVVATPGPEGLAEALKIIGPGPCMIIFSSVFAQMQPESVAEVLAIVQSSGANEAVISLDLFDTDYIEQVSLKGIELFDHTPLVKASMASWQAEDLFSGQVGTSAITGEPLFLKVVRYSR